LPYTTQQLRMESWRVVILGDGGTKKTQLATQVSTSEFH